MTPAPTTVLNPDAVAFARLKTRATKACHTAIRDAVGWVTFALWGRSVSFQDVGAASAWLDRVIGATALAAGSAEV